MSEVRGRRDWSNNEEGQETRRCKIPGKGKVREDQVHNIWVNTEEIKKWHRKEGRKVKERCCCHHSLIPFKKSLPVPFHCLKNSCCCYSYLQKSIWQFLQLAMSSVVSCCIHGCAILSLQYCRYLNITFSIAFFPGPLTHIFKAWTLIRFTNVLHTLLFSGSHYP